MRHNFKNSELAKLALVAAALNAQMAAPADKKIKLYGLPESEMEQLRTQVNNLTASLRVLAAKLDADAGVTDVNYFALTCDSALGAAAPTVLTVL